MLRSIQDSLQKKMGFAIPLFRGRGIFQYNFGFIPHRHPINVVFGKAINCPKMSYEEITPEVLNNYHNMYMHELKVVYDKYKEEFYGESPPELIFV